MAIIHQSMMKMFVRQANICIKSHSAAEPGATTCCARPCSTRHASSGGSSSRLAELDIERGRPAEEEERERRMRHGFLDDT